MIIEVLKFGFFYGCFIGLVAIGFALIYNILHIVDFAHTDRLVVSGYVYLTSLKYVNHFTAGVFAIISAILLAIFSEIFLYRRIRRLNPRLLILTTFGLSIIIQNILAIIYSDNLNEYPFIEQTVANTSLYYRELIIVPLILIICSLLYYWLNKSKSGISIRACISNYEKSLSLGIQVNKLFILIFIFSGIIAGFGGIYLSMGYGLTPYSGFKIMILAFSSCLVAGIDNLYGSVLIGVCCGILLSLFEVLFNSLTAELFTLLIFLITLFIAPNGVFGKKLRII